MYTLTTNNLTTITVLNHMMAVIEEDPNIKTHTYCIIEGIRLIIEKLVKDKNFSSSLELEDVTNLSQSMSLITTLILDTGYGLDEIMEAVEEDLTEQEKQSIIEALEEQFESGN
jgi:hypothetical protein